MTYEATFPDEMDVRWLRIYADGRRKFRMLTRHRQIRPSGEVDEVYAGDESDGASIPRFLWRFESPYGPALETAVHHDRRYQLKIGTRAEADKLFLEGMIALGIPAWKRQLMYWGVRAWGWRGWGS